MAHVTVSINGRQYQVACDDGQEAHLSRLGKYVDNRVQELVAAVGQAGDARLLVMVSLLLADELSDAYSELDTISRKSEGVARIIESEEKISSKLESLAERIEGIAARLYTGPLFAKYNAVLRGIDSDVDSLRNDMVRDTWPRRGLPEAIHWLSVYELIDRRQQDQRVRIDRRAIRHTLSIVDIAPI